MQLLPNFQRKNQNSAAARRSRAAENSPKISGYARECGLFPLKAPMKKKVKFWNWGVWGANSRILFFLWLFFKSRLTFKTMLGLLRF